MINRQNWHDVRDFLHHIEVVRLNDIETVKRARSHLRHLLEWADSMPLGKAKLLERPTLPAYLLKARADGKSGHLAPSSIIRALSSARDFYAFARAEWPHRYHLVTERWVSTLVPPRMGRAESGLVDHSFYSLETVLRIATVSTETLREERGQAAVAMLYLSGMRGDALASLPIACVDLLAGQIKQLPDMGVRTKNRKAAITYLLDIPELFDVVMRWDTRVRHLSPAALWYATLTHDNTAVTETIKAFRGRDNAVQRDVRLICARAGVPYLSPHKLRHGHVVYALKRARNMGELKAVSQNVMHSSVTITDKIYGGLTNEEIGNVIGGLSKNAGEDVGAKLDQLLELLKNK